MDSLPAEPQGKPKNTAPADLPDPGIEPGPPALQVDSLPAELYREAQSVKYNHLKYDFFHCTFQIPLRRAPLKKSAIGIAFFPDCCNTLILI